MKPVLVPPLHPRSAIGLLVAGLFFAFVVEQAPHLVHHVFDPDHVRAECVFAASADRAQALIVDVVTLPPVELSPAPAPLPVRWAVAAVALAPTDARAPPPRTPRPGSLRIHI